jgi:hypothetical protein
MDSLKPWQIAVIVLGCLGLVASLVFQLSGSNSVKMATSIQAADVLTGEVFESPLPSKRSVFFPVKNPTTGTASVYPADNTSGTWKLNARYLPYLDPWKPEQMKGLKDLKTGELVVASQGIKRVDLFKNDQ